MTETVAVATTDADYDVFGGLIREYWDWLQARYADLPGLIDAIGGHPALDAELSTLREMYGPPSGRVLLAVPRHHPRAGGLVRDPALALNRVQ